MYYYQQMWFDTTLDVIESEFKLQLPGFVSITEEERSKWSALHSVSRIKAKYQFANEQALIAFYYNYLYPQIIYDFIQAGEFQYKWRDVNELIPTPVAQEHLSRDIATFQFNNKYLNELLLPGNVTSLGYNILESGMFFPFIETEQCVSYGSHRVLSLQALHKIQPFDVQFLCLQASSTNIIHSNWSHNQHEYLGELRLPVITFLPVMSERSIYIVETQNRHTAWFIFTLISDRIGEKISQVVDTVQPLLCFNQQKAFEEFLNADK